MTEFFLNYGLFLAKTVTLVAAIVAVIYLSMLIMGRKREIRKETIEIRRSI